MKIINKMVKDSTEIKHLKTFLGQLKMPRFRIPFSDCNSVIYQQLTSLFNKSFFSIYSISGNAPSMETAEILNAYGK